jgi:hypothetical protein
MKEGRKLMKEGKVRREGRKGYEERKEGKVGERKERYEGRKDGRSTFCILVSFFCSRSSQMLGSKESVGRHHLKEGKKEGWQEGRKDGWK